MTVGIIDCPFEIAEIFPVDICRKKKDSLISFLCEMSARTEVTYLS